MWSCGVIMYVLLSGREYPFNGNNSYYNKSISSIGKLTFPKDQFKKVSEAGIDLARKLLLLAPLRRPYPFDVLEHQWFKE